MTSLSKYAVPAMAALDVIGQAGITHVTTVPDYAQLSIQMRLEEGYLPETRIVRCCSEDQAVECAAGLRMGGARPLVVMQNQGFYAAVNSIRAIGLDAAMPLPMMIGAWGREFSNLGQDPRASRRRVVAMLEPVMDAMGLRYWRIESPDDAGAIGEAIEYAFDQSAPAAILMGAYTGW